MAATTDIAPGQLDAAAAVGDTADQLQSTTFLVVIVFTSVCVVVAMVIKFHKRKEYAETCAKPASANADGASERLLKTSQKQASVVPDTQHATIAVPSPAYSSYPASTQSSTDWFPSATGKRTLSELTGGQAGSPLLSSDPKREFRHVAVDTPSSNVRQRLFINEVIDEANDDAADASQAKAQEADLFLHKSTASRVVVKDPWQAAVAANSMRSKLQLLAEMPSPPPLVVEAKGDGVSVKTIIVGQGHRPLQFELDSSPDVEADFLAQCSNMMNMNAVGKEATQAKAVEDAEDGENCDRTAAACVVDTNLKASDPHAGLLDHELVHSGAQEDTWMVHANMAGNVWEAAVAAGPLRTCLQEMAGMKALPSLVLDPLAGNCKAHAAKVVSARDGTIMLSGTSFAEVEALLSTNVTHKVADEAAVHGSKIPRGSDGAVAHGEKSAKALPEKEGALSGSLQASALPVRSYKWLEVEFGAAIQLWRRIPSKVLRGAIAALLSLVVCLLARRRLVLRKTLTTR